MDEEDEQEEDVGQSAGVRKKLITEALVRDKDTHRLNFGVRKSQYRMVLGLGSEFVCIRGICGNWMQCLSRTTAECLGEGGLRDSTGRSLAAEGFQRKVRIAVTDKGSGNVRL